MISGTRIAEEKQIARDTEDNTPFSFSEVWVTPGEQVRFALDYTVKAVVVDDRHVEYNGSIWSLSGLAQELMHLPSLPGTKFFAYQGETLADRRERLQEGES